MPWVAASTVEGMTQFELRDLRPGRYTARMVFAERQGGAAARLQTIAVQGIKVLDAFDIAATAREGRSVIQEFNDVVIGNDGRFEMTLTAVRGETLISGLELIRSDD